MPDTLYFTAGPDGESHGLFGSLDVVAEGKPGKGHAQGDGDGDDPGHSHGEH